MQEKRSQTRIVVGLPALLELGADANACIKVKAIDLSIEGMSVCSPVALGKGARCRVVMSIPGDNSKHIRVKCELIYSVLSTLSCEFRLGLHFLEFQNDDRVVLQQYIDWRSAGSGPAGGASARLN